MFSIVPGFILQRLILYDVQPQDFAIGLTALLGWRLTAKDAPGPLTVHC